MTDTRARIHDALTHATARGRLNLDGDTIASVCDVLTAEQPRDSRLVAPHGPHSPSGDPEVGAGRDRAPQSRTDDRIAHRTVEYLIQTRQPDDTWEISSGGMDAPDWAQERLLQRRERMPQFEHRIAIRTTTVTIEPHQDTGPDSQDSRQDTPDTTPGHGPLTSADTVRTSQDDTALREVLLALLSRAARGALTSAEGPLLRQRVEHLIADRDQLAVVLREILAHFTEKGHPGVPALRTSWIRAETVEKWRSVADEPRT